ncbi:MAG: YidH family protein [Planctomycetota bacterium]|jgi:putative membrane protein
MNDAGATKANEGAARGLEQGRDLRVPAALVRTALSSEQTLMSWVRTSLSLSTFGFAIAKFFQYLAGQANTSLAAGPRRLGIALILLGVLVLTAAVVEHLLRIRGLKEQGLPADASSFLPLGSAGAMLAIGLVALVSVFLKWQF